MLNTAKSIATYKEKRILSSILVIISQLIFYMVISKIISDNSILAIVIVSVSSGIGNLVAFAVNDELKKDAKWLFYMTSSNKNDVENLCSYLAENHIRYMANAGYTIKGEDTININAFSKTKEESRQIEKYIENGEHKYLKEIV